MLRIREHLLFTILQNTQVDVCNGHDRDGIGNTRGSHGENISAKVSWLVSQRNNSRSDDGRHYIVTRPSLSLQ